MKTVIASICILVTATSAWAVPNEFTCKPDEWYSGGFDIFYVTRTESPNEGNVFHGTRYWQATHPHGNLNGKPKITGEYELRASVLDSAIRLDGLANTFLESVGVGLQSLEIPESWEMGSIQVESELFYNDINGRNGSCIAGKDPSIN